jgi:glycosyltransferase involved in cell wall biosynthesis
MKAILILSPQYHPETGAAARRITDMAEFLANKGWKVSVITQAPHYPQNSIYEGYGLQSPDIRIEQGVEVVRLNPWIVPRSNLALRLLSESLFCVKALVQGLRRKSDVILASSPYMFLGPTGLLLARLCGAKFVWDVRDLTWLYPKATGKPTYGLDRSLEAIMLWTASRAHALTTVTEGLRSYFARRPSRAEVLPNGVSDKWADQLLSLPQEVERSKPVVVYAGLLGYNHALGTLIETAKLLPEVEFKVAGDGPERPALEQKAAALGANNVAFLGYLGQDDLLDLYQEAALLVSHLRQNPLYRWTQPAKLWEYMATGRPVIHAGEGEVVDILLRDGLAAVVPPEQPQALAQAIRELLSNPDKGREMGERARVFVDQERRRSKLLERFGELIESLME